MELFNKNAEIYVPDGVINEKALRRTTHMAIGAHQDDIEIMAYDGILKCYGRNAHWFSAVIATNGEGSSRNGKYIDTSNSEMSSIRTQEQKKAADNGEYGSAVFLNYSSSDIKNPKNRNFIEDIKQLIIMAKPEVIYTHNLADKHDTHVSTAVKVIQALRELDKSLLPEKIYGCEVWRGLDWLNDSEKIAFDVAENPELAESLLQVFDSQISGGKRYDLATIGRRLANATFIPHNMLITQPQ